MKKRIFVLALVPLFLTGCSRYPKGFRVDSSRAEADTVKVSCNLRWAGDVPNIVEYTVPQELPSALKDQVLDFDQEVRKAKDIQAKQKPNGDIRIGVYELFLGEGKRFLDLDPDDGGGVYFSGDIGNLDLYEGYLPMSGELLHSFQSLWSQLTPIVESSETKTAQLC